MRQLSQLEKNALANEVERKVNFLTWAGLGFMSMQFGVLARLTWWEYSWDIMEPVTYFVTYGTAMAMYAYYCITKTEYNLNEVKDRTFLLNIHKRAKKKNFDIEKYNQLKRSIAEIEYDLRRLRDPINLKLPTQLERNGDLPPDNGDQNQSSPGSGTNSDTITKGSADCKKKTSSRFQLFDTKN